MTEVELKNQRTRAKANYQLKQMEARSGKATADDVAEAKRIYEALRDYQLKPESQEEKNEKETPKPEIFLPKMSEVDFRSLLEDLTIERHQAHKQMCLLSNTLGNYPDGQNIKHVVDEIQAYKRQRNEIGERIDYLKANGRLPEAEPQTAGEVVTSEAKTAYLANLPNDRYEINKLLKDSLLPNLSKARKKVLTAKTDATRFAYEKKVAILEAQVEVARQQLATLS